MFAGDTECFFFLDFSLIKVRFHARRFQENAHEAIDVGGLGQYRNLIFLVNFFFLNIRR